MSPPEKLPAPPADLEPDRKRNHFLDVLAHELRNPLAPILNAVELLKEVDSTDPRLLRARETIERQARHQARLLDDLLCVSRLAGGGIRLRQEWVDLARVARECAEDYRPALEDAGLDLRLELPGEPVRVLGDPTRLAQVLGNLLQNALRFTEPGGSVLVRAERSGESGARLLVRDTGRGIAAELLPRLFEPFAQAETPPERSREGLGLGLAIARGLVELHGGRIEAASAGPGRGAEIRIDLPLAPSGAAMDRIGVPAGPTAPSRAGGMRVLVIEDNPDAAETLRDLLEMYGHEAEVACSGRTGLDAARRFHPQVVLCDLGLPGMDGYGVAAALRRLPELDGVRLIAISGYGRTEDRNRALAAGFDLHLTKPVDPRTIETLLAQGVD